MESGIVGEELVRTDLDSPGFGSPTGNKLGSSCSPFIKRKCLDLRSGQKCVRRASLMGLGSPYSLSAREVFADSPKLNESFEVLHISNKLRRRVNFVKHKSANFEENCSPLNDISNQMNLKPCLLSSAQLKLDEVTQEESDLAELENLIFGPNSNENSQCVKQMVETRATCNNLIGDCSKKHVLPVVSSSKHHDLHCISPQTVISLLFPPKINILYHKKNW